MAHTGFGYYYNRLGLSTDDLAFYFNFNESGNNTSFSGDRTFSLYGNTGQFWQSSGSGYFSGTNLKVVDADFNHDYFTCLLIYNKIKTGDAILMSTLTTGASGASGFLLGINDANKLYLTAYDASLSSYITDTFDFSLGRTNGISVSKNLNNFTVGKFNFSERELYTSQKNLPPNCSTSGIYMYLGSGSGLPSQVINNGFVGYIDEIALTTQNLNEDFTETLFSSFYKVEPTQQYLLTGEYDSYQYSNLNNVSSPIWEELQSGALDYIRTNIFNTTGIGSILVTNSGTVINGTGYVSGNLSGTVARNTGYYEVTTGTRVTGYASSGQVATSSGITGYIDINLYPITVFSSGNIYQLSAQSGITGYTDWVSVFSGPMYESYNITGLVEDTLSTDYTLNFSYVITGLTGDASYLHLATYANNGDDNIIIGQDLSYTGNGAEFRAFKRTQLKYESGWVEGNVDSGYIDNFKMDGITLLYPVKSSDVLELYSQNYTGQNYYNKQVTHSLVSGLFGYTGELDSDDLFFFTNGIYQASNRFYQDMWISTGVDILYESGESWITDSTFSGDYDLVNNYFLTDINYDRNDSEIIDNIPFLNITRTRKYITGISEFISGYALAITGSGVSQSDANGLFFINGAKLISGIDYDFQSGGFRLNTNDFSGTTGILIGASLSGLGNIATGISATGITKNALTGLINESSSLLFYNRLRQNLNIDYIETSSLDTNYNLSGFYELNLNELVNI